MSDEPNTVSHDEIAQLREAVRGVVGAAATDPTPVLEPWRDRWPALVELGVTAFGVPEDRGGLGWQVQAAAATAHELGAALHGSPFAAVTAAAIALSGSPDDRAAAVLGQVLMGAAVCGFAVADTDAGVAHLVDSAPELDAVVVSFGEGGPMRLYPDRSAFAVDQAGDSFDVTRTVGRIVVDPASGVPLGDDPRAVEVMRVLLAADSLGGVERMLARTVEYAGQRIAFGKPIGANQAVQHRLVDHTVRARGLSLLIGESAHLLATGSSGAGPLVALTELQVHAGAPAILNDLVQLTGGIGFTWEYGLHFFVRRAHRNARLGANPWSAERRIARLHGWDAPPTATAGATAAPASAPDDEVRARTRAFVEANAFPLRREGVRVPADAEQERRIRAWLASLYDAGLLGAGWPEEHGGRPDHQPMHDLILMEELIRAGAYRPIDQVMLAAHAIVEHGTDDQKATLLPRIRRGEHIWCQLFSEPDAGSDLASLRTRAEPDADGFTVTGQKIWTTDGQWADMAMLLARTDPTVDRHAGLTAFVVPMDLPGIEIREIRENTGEAEFCEVFLDGVRLGPEHVLGEVNGGWRVISSGLASERAFVGANALQLEMMFADLVDLARTARFPDGAPAIDHEVVQRDLAHALGSVQAVKLIVRDTVDRILRDAEHPSDGSLAKLAYTEMNVRLTEQAMHLIDCAVPTAGSTHEIEDRWRHNFLWGRSLTISGGSSEILRGLIGRQLLRLPRA